eukprot:scaffold3746_cov319-Prasinococcus_capsulatus_cf.AAC.1
MAKQSVSSMFTCFAIRMRGAVGVTQALRMLQPLLVCRGVRSTGSGVGLSRQAPHAFAPRKAAATSAATDAVGAAHQALPAPSAGVPRARERDCCRHRAWRTGALRGSAVHTGGSLVVLACVQQRAELGGAAHQAARREVGGEGGSLASLPLVPSRAGASCARLRHSAGPLVPAARTRRAQAGDSRRQCCASSGGPRRMPIRGASGAALCAGRVVRRRPRPMMGRLELARAPLAAGEGCRARLAQLPRRAGYYYSCAARRARSVAQG